MRSRSPLSLLSCQSCIETVRESCRQHIGMSRPVDPERSHCDWLSTYLAGGARPARAARSCTSADCPGCDPAGLPDSRLLRDRVSVVAGNEPGAYLARPDAVRVCAGGSRD